MKSGRQPSNDYSPRKSLVMSLQVWQMLTELRRYYDVSISAVFRMAIAVLHDNPTLWDAYREYSDPETVRQVETGRE